MLNGRPDSNPGFHPRQPLAPFPRGVDRGMIFHPRRANRRHELAQITALEIKVGVDSPLHQGKCLPESRNPNHLRSLMNDLQPSNLSSTQFGNGTASIRRPVDRRVMHEHQITIHRLANVDFNQIRPDRDGFLDRGQGILGRPQQDAATMGYDPDAGPFILRGSLTPLQEPTVIAIHHQHPPPGAPHSIGLAAFGLMKLDRFDGDPRVNLGDMDRFQLGHRLRPQLGFEPGHTNHDSDPPENNSQIHPPTFPRMSRLPQVELKGKSMTTRCRLQRLIVPLTHPSGPPLGQAASGKKPRRMLTTCNTWTLIMLVHQPSRIRQPGILLLTTLLASLLAAQLTADSWPQWRGPNRDGKSAETGLLKSWPEAGPPLAWKVTELGEGYATPSVAQGRIFGASYRGEDEFAWALDESGGRLIWETRTAPAERDVGYSHGPRSTPTVDGDRVFTLGAGGHLTCMDRQTGTILWQKNLKEDLNGRMMSGWGYSESVLVDGNRVLCSPGGRQGTVACLNRDTGELVWRSTQLKDSAAYTSITKQTIDGHAQYLTLTGETLAGISPDTGALVWRAKRKGKTAVIATPIYHEGTVFVTSAYNVGCNLFEISQRNGRFNAKERYAHRDVKNHHGGAIRIGDHIFASSGPILVCLDMASGEVAWEQRSVGKGSLTFADGHLYLRSEQGPIALIEANPKQYVEKGRFGQPDRSGKRSWAHPVVANGHLLLRDQDLLLSYDLRPQR